MKADIALLKSIADGWKQEWKLRVYELGKQKLAVSRAKDRWKQAEHEYKAALAKLNKR